MGHERQTLLLPALVVALTTCGAAGWGQGTDAADPVTPRLNPEAVEILQRATDFLAAQPALSVNWFASYDVVIDGREKITELRSGYSLLDREADNDRLLRALLAEARLDSRQHRRHRGPGCALAVRRQLRGRGARQPELLAQPRLLSRRGLGGRRVLLLHLLDHRLGPERVGRPHLEGHRVAQHRPLQLLRALIQRGAQLLRLKRRVGRLL